MFRTRKLPLLPDRPPPMFVGDEEPVAAPLVSAGETEAAAMLPANLAVVVEGTSRTRVPLLSAVVLGTAAAVYGAFKSVVMMPSPGQYQALYALLAGGIAALSAFGHRRFIRRREEYRLADDGIVLEVWHDADRKPWTTRIPWTEISDFTVAADREEALLHVESVRGYTLSLRDRPPRLSTREFIRRFTEQAERHPRAVRSDTSLESSAGLSPMELAGFAALTAGGFALGGAADLSLRQTLATVLMLVILHYGLRIWSMLDDLDTARPDPALKRLAAGVRRWLRKVLGINPI